MALSQENRELLEKLKTLVQAADDQAALMQSEIDKLAVKTEETEEDGEEEKYDTQHAIDDITTSVSKMNVTHSPKLSKFLKGENFAQYCERFKEYAYLYKLKDKKLHLYFLQHMNDETYSILKSVTLAEREQQDPELFCDEYKRAIYGEESATLKADVFECKQLSSESIEEFAYRLREKADVAFSDKGLANQNCLITFIKGVRDPYIGRKLNEEELHDFNNAVKLAKRLEVIERMYGDKKDTSPTSILRETQVSFAKSDTTGENRERFQRSESPTHRTQSRSRERYPRSRTRSSSYDSRNSDRGFRSRSRSNSRWSQDRGRSRQRFSRSRSRDTRGNNGSKRCWHCNKVGHIRRQCWNLQSQNGSLQRNRNNGQTRNGSNWNGNFGSNYNTRFGGSNSGIQLN